jgi:hypothetical protein
VSEPGYRVALRAEFERIRETHKSAVRETACRVVPGSSVIRVFLPHSKTPIQEALRSIEVDELPSLDGRDAFRKWFERELDRLAQAIKRSNVDNHRILPGYKWGHAAKILTLYLRGIVLSSRYFTDQEVERITRWLYTPIDSVIIRRLRKLGVRLPFRSIKEIDSADKFYHVQRQLEDAARDAGVPRVWFDDNWGYRQ